MTTLYYDSLKVDIISTKCALTENLTFKKDRQLHVQANSTTTYQHFQPVQALPSPKGP